MHCPKLVTQGQFIGEGEEGKAFAYRNFGDNL
jgi:hypothetical protein